MRGYRGEGPGGLFNDQDLERLRESFPKLSVDKDRVTSGMTHRGNPVVYNCVAWAANDSTQWWQYDPEGELGFEVYWPKQLTEGDSVDSWVKLFETELDYSVSADDCFEQGYEKVAIYEKDGEASHVARQIGRNKWTSKLGFGHDIEHERLESLCGFGEHEYGRVAVILKRKKPYAKGQANRKAKPRV